MYELHYGPTPNGFKVTVLLEELGVPYTLVPVSIGRGEQFTPSFLRLSPNNRMPALVDTEPLGGGEPIAIFESGAILLYLAEKHGRFLPTDLRGRWEVTQWVFWQMAGLGPMSGQAFHFRNYAPEKVQYAIDRYTNEVNRLYGVLERQLEGRPFIAGEYSVADMACFPWMLQPSGLGQDLAHFPNVARWHAAMKARPAVQRGVDVGADLRRPAMDEEARKVLFGQTAASVTSETPKA
jgi:GST-like protein